MSLKTIVLVLAILFMWNSSFAFEITFITHSIEGKTYTDKNGELRGVKNKGRRSFQLELVREMMSKLNHQPRTFEIYPFKRVFFIMKENERPHAMFSLTRRPDRENLVKWVGPLTTDTTYLYELQSTPTGIKTLEDDQKLPICVLRGGFMDTPETKRNYQDLSRNTFKKCFKMLLGKRVKLAQASESELLAILQNAEINPDLIQNTKVYFLKSTNYLAFSNQVPDRVVQQWQTTLDGLKKSGRYDQLYDLYFRSE